MISISQINNQGKQNEGQVPDTIIADFEIFQFLTEARQSTGFKSF